VHQCFALYIVFIIDIKIVLAKWGGGGREGNAAGLEWGDGNYNFHEQLWLHCMIG
jgi:hypothetical protein